MREIKFRAWFEGEMLSNEQLVQKDQNTTCVFTILTENPQKDDVVFMQYTGLKDKNGKEIYEGDIVESLTKINGYVCRGVVIFENGKFMVDVKKAAFARDGFISDFDLKIREYEVIGNIYEHKHLLEVES